MIISIIFLLASLAFIIFLPIYVKRKNSFYSLRPNDKEKTSKQKKNIKSIWGIDKIKDGIITIQGKHSIIIELGSIEYRLLNGEEQNNIDLKLTTLAKTFVYQTQFFSTIEKIDTNDKIDNIRENIIRQKNDKIKDYGEYIIEYLENIMQEDNLYVRKNYLIISSNEHFNKAQTDLFDYYNEIKYHLFDIKVKCKILSDIEIIELLHREFNKNSEEKIKKILDQGGMEFNVSSEEKEKRGKEGIIRKGTKN